MPSETKREQALRLMQEAKINYLYGHWHMDEDEAMRLVSIIRTEALEEAAKRCGDKWREGYRGEVSCGFQIFLEQLAKEVSDAK